MERKRTKIVATISDKNCEASFLKQLYEAGMDVVRINSAHLDTGGALKIVRNVREISDKIAILIDTKGPEIRTTECDAPINIKKGEIVRIIGEQGKKTTEEEIYVSYPAFSRDVPLGSVIMIDDGEIELKASRREGKILECIAENDGQLGSKKSVNVPGVRIKLPSVTERDREFIRFAVENHIDFIAHSFVRSRQDVLDVQAELDKLGSEIKIIAKIENQEGVDNFGEIIDSVYGIMVARGDLAIEMPFEKIPGLQKMMIARCIYMRKPVIVATQMLHSMISNPRPTRAEVSDVANAIYSQTDAIMLSGETASGKYPVESVRTMTRIAVEAEKNKEKIHELPYVNVPGQISAHLAKVAVSTSIEIGAKVIIADTLGGRTIKDMASYRGIKLIMAQCYSERTMRELALSYGVYADFQEKRNTVDEFIHVALSHLESAHGLKNDDIIVVLAGNFSGRSGFSFIEVGSLQYLRDRVSIRNY
jgi:pyruvate kinase